jgi:hypothetical protein
MNIVKLQNELKRVPDEVLIGYVQNPNGQVPSYLALTELQYRKEVRDKYQEQKAPESSVAEDLTQQGGIASIAPQQAQAPMQVAQAEMPQAPQGMAQGGVAELDTGDMYQEQNFATGGIVAFAKGGSAFDEYGIEMPPGATLDDISMEMQESNRLYGVDPEFYKKQAEELKRQKEELAAEKAEAGWMGLARAGLGMAAGTSPYALKNISEGAIQGVTQYGADVKDIKAQDRLLKQAEMKLAEAQQAEARGDARASMKLMDDRNNKLLDAQLKRAEIGIKDKIAAAKASGDTSKAEALLHYHAAQLGEQKFVNAYPAGAVSGYLADNEALVDYIRQKYVMATEKYLRGEGFKEPGPFSDLKKEFEAKYPNLANKPSTGKTSTDKPLSTKPAATKPTSTRPADINNILNKYPPKNTSNVIVPQKRNTNTPAELELNRRLEYFNQYPPSEGQADEDEEV